MGVNYSSQMENSKPLIKLLEPRIPLDVALTRGIKLSCLHSVGTLLAAMPRSIQQIKAVSLQGTMRFLVVYSVWSLSGENVGSTYEGIYRISVDY